MSWLISLAWSIRYWLLDRRRRHMVTIREAKRRRAWDTYFARGGQW